MIAAQAWTPDGSTLWNWADEHVGRGFAILGVAWLVTVLAAVATWVDRRPEARLARRIHPVAGGNARTADRSATARPPGDAFAELLNRDPRIPYLHALVIVGAVLLGVATGVAIGPAWNASHGHGGPTYTFGEDATLDHTSVSSHGHRDYFLSTPSGVVLDEDGTPHRGQRFVVSGDVAYRVGGHSYLLIGALVLTSAGTVLGAVVILGRRWRRENRRRQAHPVSSVADALAAIARSSAPPELWVGLRLSGTLGVASADVRRAIRRRRIVVGTGTATIAVLAAAAITIERTGVFTSPPANSFRQIPALTTALDADPGVYVSYSDQKDAHALLVDVDGGRTPTVTWSLTTAGHAGPARYISILFFRMPDPVAAQAGRRGLLGFARGADQHPAADPGLPAGWDGAVTGERALRKAMSLTVEGSLLVEVEVSGEAGTTDAHLAASDAQASAAVAHVGIAALAHLTRR